MSNFLSIFSTIIIIIISTSSSKSSSSDSKKTEEGNILFSITEPITIEYNPHKTNQYNKNYFVLQLKVGDPAQTFNVQIDTRSSISWLPSKECSNCFHSTKKYDYYKSYTSKTTDKKVKLKDEDGDIEGYKYYEDLNLNGYKLKKFSFVAATKLEKDFRDHYDGKIGLGYNTDEKNEDFNFLNKVQKDGLGIKKVFSIHEINSTNGLFYLGDLPIENYSYCEIVDPQKLNELYYDSWICSLSHVGIFNTKNAKNYLYNYYQIKNLVTFDSAYDFISLPIKEKYLIENALKMANLDCYTNLEKDEKIKDEPSDKHEEDEISIFCNNDLNDVPDNVNFSFVLDGYGFNLPLNKLFKESSISNDKIEMLVKYINNKKAIWTFGHPFMQLYMLIFNFDEKHVGISVNSNRKSSMIVNLTKEWDKWAGKEYTKIKIDEKNRGIVISIAIILSFCLLFVLFVMMWMSIRNKSKANGPTMNMNANTNNNANNNENNNNNRVY